MIREPNQRDVDHAFRGTDFGTAGETPEGRTGLVADCVLKRACDFWGGGTITAICKELGMLTPRGAPRRWAKQWAYMHVVYNRKGEQCTPSTDA